MKKTSKKVKIIISGLLVGGLLASVPLLAPTSYAQGIDEGLQVVSSSSVSKNTVESTVPKIINVMLYIVGILAVAMLIFGGIKYATSAGDSSKITAAKHTIMYSIVGLVVALFAFAIVNWVNTQVGSSSGSGSGSGGSGSAGGSGDSSGSGADTESDEGDD